MADKEQKAEESWPEGVGSVGAAAWADTSCWEVEAPDGRRLSVGRSGLQKVADP